MKRTLHSISFIIVSVLLTACPYSSPYPLDESPQQSIDESYLGKWATMVTKIIDDRHSKIEPVKVILTKKDDMEYNVAITGYIDEFVKYRIVTDDTIKGTAFLSTAVNKQFLNIDIAGRIYLAEVKKDDGTFSIYPLSDYFTNKMIKSTPALRNALEFHYKTRLNPSYDEDFMLKDLKRVN
ncbi:hypothetical protein LK994_05385 [Ferruginibacter lapsinanis]|uniref:hypothetical protein n=1 Tax=Ferruginibacter lapsinanis TaxID=563172 RepID=UPI001E5B3250|nr:hypothetical protein [Ferruginibacter lapsinanis]UEG50905.1 hypothetical protein LK994_05385 [Ferruginibacter lapsinanis]